MSLSTPSLQPVVRISGVSKRFGSAVVLRDLWLDILPGTFTGLVGINGAGKTTLIKCLLDFCSLDTGKIEIFGLPHHSHKSRFRLSFLPERFTPPHFLSGREFVRTMLGISGLAYEEMVTRSMFNDLGLHQSALDKPVRSFSKGMTQKLGLAACLLSQRDFFLLDEPMTGLDPAARVRVKNLLGSLKAKGKTLLFTSHSLADIEEICDHMVVLHGGGIAFSGTPRDLRNKFEEPTLELAFLRCIGTDG